MSIDWARRAPKPESKPASKVRSGLNPKTIAERKTARPTLLIAAPDDFVGRTLTWRDLKKDTDAKRAYVHGLSWVVDATLSGQLWVEDGRGHEVLVVESAVHKGESYTVRLDG